MVQTEMSKVWRFLSGFRPGRLVDTGRDGPESYADTVGCAMRHESLMRTEKSVSPGVGEGSKEMAQPSPL